MMTVYVIAAEPSGDVVGSELMRGLTAATAGGVRFAGIGGPAMAEHGLISLFDYSELTLLGVFEVLPKAAHVLKRVRETVAHIEEIKPDLVLTIDAWGFTGRVHKALTKRGSQVPRVRAVAPQVWAWRAGRARQLSQWIDHLLTLFAFEPPYFEKHGLATTWIGHPVLGTTSTLGDGQRFRQTHGIPEEHVLLGVLPGSRKREVKTLLPVFKQVAAQLSEHPITCIVPVAPGVADLVQSGLADWPCAVVPAKPGEKADALAAMDAAIAASGTVTLELAQARVPHVIAYRLSWLTGQVLKRMATTQYANMVNIMEDAPIVPECLMENCTVEGVHSALQPLLTDDDARAAQLAAFERVEGQLSRDGKPPGEWAAQVILDLVNARAR